MKKLHHSMCHDLMNNLTGIALSMNASLVGNVRIAILVDCLLSRSIAVGEMVLDDRGEVEIRVIELVQYAYALCANLVGRG